VYKQALFNGQEEDKQKNRGDTPSALRHPSLHRQRFVIRHCIVSASSSVIASSTIASSTFRWCMAFWNEAGLRTRIPMPAEDLGLFVDDDAQRAGPGGPDDLDEAERAVVLPM